MADSPVSVIVVVYFDVYTNFEWKMTPYAMSYIPLSSMLIHIDSKMRGNVPMDSVWVVQCFLSSSSGIYFLISMIPDVLTPCIINHQSYNVINSSISLVERNKQRRGPCYWFRRFSMP
jgi:hypothetical protein